MTDDAPSRARRRFLPAEGRPLVMLSYEVDLDVLAPLAPAGLALDLWHGRALVSVVGFRFLDTRVLGAAIAWHRDFDEVNLGFYARRDVPGGGTRHGGVSVRELVSRLAVALLARLAYNEPYRAVRMRSATPRGASDAPGRLAYEWRIGGAWEGLAATAVGAPTAPEPGSQGALLTQHHWGDTPQRDGGTAEYAAVPPPWPGRTAGGATLTMDVARLYRPAVAPALARAAGAAPVAGGAAVIVYAPRRLVTTEPRRMSLR